MSTRKHLSLALVTLALASCGRAPIPTSLELGINPSRVWYHTGQSVELFADLRSHRGEEIADLELLWTVEPAGAATLGAPGMDPRTVNYTLDLEGTTTFTVCVPPRREEDPPTLCDSLRVRVDDGMPSLEVASPTPGQELTGEPIVEVLGSVADRSMVNVYINGTPAVVDEMGSFSGTTDALFGVNHIVVSASDGLTDASEVELDVLWAPEYTPALGADGTPQLLLDDGLGLWLGQDFFDDGSGIALDARPVETHDLADVLELVVASVDVGSYLPDPVVDSPPTFVLRVPRAAIGEPHVEIDLTDDGVDLFVRIGLIEVDTSGALVIEGVSLPLDGTITASAVAFAHITIRKESEAVPLEVTTGAVSVGLESLEGRFMHPDTAAIFQLAEGILRPAVEGALVDALTATIESSVPEVLRGALGSLDTALAGQSFEIASDPFPPVTIGLDGGIRVLQLSHRRELSTLLRTEIGSSTPSIHPESLGVPRLTTLPALPFVNEGRLQLGLRLALLNGLLHSLWASGFFEVDASSILPDSISSLVSEARIFGRMQPVLRPPRVDETDHLVLSLGQLELELLYMGETVRFGMSLDAGMNLSFADNRIAIAVAEEPVIRIWTLQAPSNPRSLTPDTIRTLLLNLWPDLSSSVAGGLGFDLPTPALGDLGGLAPDLASLTLGLESTGELRYRRGVLVLEASLNGTLP